ncbi:hypothetical protein [Cognataquiflexum rubidum]|uniref:hypothetical protein n=1 Tax=Cognataquiflexum rubidum TaxID=2922273 RepID=UPI001F147E5F|nr:hypothetical protein [Cognataquiflexum rubidum]MCH6235724.1 hypothetical protein [Cognataquiflexum rubidum]
MDENKNIPEVRPTEKEQPVLHATTVKKNWTSYIKEFLMLFLAVFCGFLAENYRDSLSEQQKEKQFIRSYIEDLKVDTAAIQANLVYQKSRRGQLDSLIYLFREQKIEGNENELYYYGRMLIRTRRFQNSDRTISQLKSSGSMRLIRSESAADSIISYQKLVETILTNIEDERVERRATDPMLMKIFDPYVFDQMLDNNNKVNKPTDNPPLRSYDKELHQDFAYHIHLLSGSNLILTTRQEQLFERAINIIVFLQKEYSLEE